MPSAGRAFLVTSLLVALAACPNRVVVVNGQEMSPEQAEEEGRAELEAVRREAQALTAAEAGERFSALAGKYRGTEIAAEALQQAGDLFRAAGRPDRAVQVLSTLVAEHPLYPRALDAKYALALAQMESGRVRDGLTTLGSLYGQLPAEQRPEAARRAAAAAEAANALEEAVRWQAEVAAQATGDSRRAAVARAAELIDQLSFAEVEQLRGTLPREAAVQEALTMKAARIHLHLRDYTRAQEEAREVFLRWPDGPYAQDAKAMVDRITRLTLVKPNVIGVAVPLSGTYKRWGEAILQGVGLALGDGAGVKLAIRDTRGEPAGAAQAIESLVLEEGAIVVIGGVTNAEADRAAAAAEELSVPLVSLSRQEGVTDAGPHVFQNMLTADAQARALVEFAMDRRGMKRFAVMYPTIPYGTELANAFWDEVENRGGEMRAAESYAPDRTTFTPLVKDMVGKLYLDERSDYQDQAKEITLKEKDPFRRRKALEKLRDKLDPVTDFDAIFIPDFPKNLKLLTPALAVEDVVTQTCLPEEVKRIAKSTGRPDLKPVQLLGANGWGGDPSLYDTSPGAPGRYLRCAIFVDGFFAGSARPATRAFVDAFQKKYGGQTPTILEASAYDAARMVRERMGARKVQTREELRDELAAVKAFPGATGDITMGPRRTPEKQLFFLTIDQGGLRELTQEELTGEGPAQGAN
ncbi:MAG TPA: penicillin-binding protein activator [Anaeromyxobacter sp.]|nr:penicillin-binding protein activator [Anaeromyxobacter sp.]